jgi:hypothetical protein
MMINLNQNAQYTLCHRADQCVRMNLETDN